MTRKESKSWDRETTKEGWSQFVKRKTPEAPPRLSPSELAKLSAQEKQDYDRARRHFVGNMPPITSLYQPYHDEMDVLMLLNEHKPSGPRSGVAIDGNPSNGKTTMVKQYGRMHELRMRAHHPMRLTSRGHEFLPVVYVSLDSLPTIKALNQGLLSFYGHVPKRATAYTMTEQILTLAALSETSLIILDDVHNLELHRDSDRDANNHLKHLANDLNATFIYAGVGLDGSGFMSEGKTGSSVQLSQISRRFKLIPVGPLSNEDEADQEMLSGILNVYEQLLPLSAFKSGDLVDLAEYVWKRTQGVIGSISSLVSEAYIRAMLDGSERITKRTFSKVVLDHDAEKGFDIYRKTEHPESLLVS